MKRRQVARAVKMTKRKRKRKRKTTTNTIKNKNYTGIQSLNQRKALLKRKKKLLL
jgi:hypothetical protein